MNLIKHLRRGLLAVAAAASVVGGVGGTARADNAAATTPRTVSAATVTAAAHAPTPDGALTAVTAPRAPRSPTAIPRNTAVKLTWLAPSSNGGAKINTYRVQRATSAKGPWTTIAKPTVRRYRATGLSNGTRYYFRVAAHNAAGWGTPSKVVSAVPRTVPTAPRSPTATPGNTIAKLAWLRPASNGGATIDRYRVQRATSTAGPWTTIAKPTTRSHTAGGLANGTRYYFRLAAHNAAGWGQWSTIASVTPRTVPSAPLGLWWHYDKPSDSVTWYWSPPASAGGAAIDHYVLEWSPDQTGWYAWKTTSQTSQTSGVSHGLTFYFRVKAHNAAGYGPASNSTVVTLP
jgi:hypothetical protein